ncbi:MAG: terminase small subunit, partial [Abditibacteriaceae bacterium]
KRKTGERGPDKKPRAKAKPRTSNKPKIPGAKVIVKATDELTDDILDNDGDIVSIAPRDGLTPRQILFVEHYMQTFNARLSMQLAGYKGSTESLCAHGSRMVRFGKVAKLITFYMESHAMPKTELAARNARIARGSFGSFLRIEDDALGRPTARLDLASPEAIANHDLIKEWDGKEIDKIVSEGDGGRNQHYLSNKPISSYMTHKRRLMR